MIDIEKLLKANAGVDDYRIVTQKTKSFEVFFVHRKLETVRATDTVTTDVTVYVNCDGKLGDSAFAIYESTTEEMAAQKIEAAVNRARLALNQAYTLPVGGSEYAELPTNFTEYAMPELAQKVADAVFAADCYAGGSINATEIFLYEDTTNVRNSRGVDKTQVKRHAMIEAIPTWNEGAESVELYEDHRFASFDAAKVTQEIDRRMQEVRDRQRAVKLAPQTLDVALNRLEISSLLGNILRNMNFSSLYMHANLYKAGDDLQAGGTGDKLTVTMVKEIPGSVESARFDADGVDLTDRLVIENGVVVGNYGVNRFAQYLGQTPTGNLRCAKVAPGTLTEEELKAAPYLECVSLSGLQVDLYSDYVGGEIRLAYLHEGEKKTPVTGISMSARLSEVLKTLRMTEKTIAEGNYEGPEKFIMKGVSVL